MKKNRHCCRRCQFLTKNISAYGTQPWDKEDRVFCWPEGNRDKIYLSGIPEENRGYFKVYKVGCYKNEWERHYDDLAGGSSRQSLKEEILRNREGQCFFVEYPAGRTFPEAEERFRVSRDTRHQKGSLFWTKVAVGVAILGVLISIASQIFRQSSTP